MRKTWQSFARPAVRARAGPLYEFNASSSARKKKETRAVGRASMSLTRPEGRSCKKSCKNVFGTHTYRSIIVYRSEKRRYKQQVHKANHV